MKKLITALVVAPLLAGCTGDNGEPEPTETPTATLTASPTAPPTATTTPTPETPPEEAAAKQAVIDFWKVRDELASDPALELTRLSEVARGQALEAHRSTLISQAQSGLRQVGSVVVTPNAVESATSAQRYIVAACVNVSQVDVVDADGESVVSPNRMTASASDYTVEQDGEQWYVVEDTFEQRTC